MSLILGSVNWCKCRIQLVIKQVAYFSPPVSEGLLNSCWGWMRNLQPSWTLAFPLETVMVLRLGEGWQQPPFTGCCPEHFKRITSFNLPNNPMKYVLLSSILQLEKKKKNLRNGEVKHRICSRLQLSRHLSQGAFSNYKVLPPLTEANIRSLTLTPARRGKGKEKDYSLLTFQVKGWIKVTQTIISQQLYWDIIHMSYNSVLFSTVTALCDHYHN